MTADPTMTAALGSGDVTKLGIGLIIALVVIGALLSAVITALVGRIIVIVVVVVLAIAVWQQRGHVKDSYTSTKCDLHATFFGISIDAPDSVKQACQNRPSA